MKLGFFEIKRFADENESDFVADVIIDEYHIWNNKELS